MLDVDKRPRIYVHDKKRPIKDITGVRIGRLVALKYSHSAQDGRVYWLFRCDCGVEKAIRSDYGIISCGCAQNDEETIRRRAASRTRHGMSGSRLDNILNGMKERCHNPKAPAFSNYGARGIEVCEEWRTDSSSFFNWALENGYSDDLQIERINNNLGYSPSNCRFATILEQGNNKRNNVFMEFAGKTMTRSQWARELGVNVSLLENRFRYGWSVEEMLSIPKSMSREEWYSANCFTKTASATAHISAQVR
jgi:hypothetical protein